MYIPITAFANLSEQQVEEITKHGVAVPRDGGGVGGIEVQESVLQSIGLSATALDIVKNAARAAARALADGMRIVEDEIFEQRSAICAACPFGPNRENVDSRFCMVCGCKSMKLKIASERCPIGKWESISSPELD